MIEHIVLFKWKSDTTSEAIDAAMAALKGLRTVIPGIVDLTIGPNFTDRSQGFTHGLVVRFADKAALDHYGPCAEHQAVVQKYILPIREDILAVDYEI